MGKCHPPLLYRNRRSARVEACMCRLQATRTDIITGGSTLTCQSDKGKGSLDSQLHLDGSFHWRRKKNLHASIVMVGVPSLLDWQASRMQTCRAQRILETEIYIR